jgi:hypothetical protein
MATKKTNAKKLSTNENPNQKSTGINQVIKRPLNNADLELITRFYRSIQNRLKPLAIISIGLAIINVFFLSDLIMDWIVEFLLYLFMLLVGVVAMVASLNMLLVRKRISDALKQGTILEVNAPAYRNQLARNAKAWTIGPISVTSAPAYPLNMIQEGAQTKVLCIPKMKVALSINNVELKFGTRMICPPNLEAMAVLEQNLPQGDDMEEEIEAKI